MRTGKGVCGGGNFGSALLQPSRTLCVYGGTAAGAQRLRLSERFFIVTELRVVIVGCMIIDVALTFMLWLL